MNRAVAHEVVRSGILGLAAMMTFALPATAQRLWSVEEVTTRPLFPIEVAGVVESAATTVGAGPTTVEAATVQVEFDYLRLGMGYLELPLVDGSVIAAENAVFEDRGDGNFLWTGEVPGAGYESVLFTVQDGHLVGWFGEPGGPKYVVQAGPDGRGTLSAELGPTGDWCGAEAAPTAGGSSHYGVVPPVAGQASAASGSDDNERLEILVLYTERAERWWRPVGGAAVGVQQLEDYLNMVFRNGEISPLANVTPVRWQPATLSDPLFLASHREPQYGGCFVGERAWSWPWEIVRSADVADLRRRHASDIVYFVTMGTYENHHLDRPGLFNGFGGQAWGYRTDLDPRVGLAWGAPDGQTFAHEIGHTLGGQHTRYVVETVQELPSPVEQNAVRPYAFAHIDLDSCVTRDRPYCPGTTMVGSDTEAWHKIGGSVIREPFYSSVRHRPNGWTIGVAGEAENERVFQETVPILRRSSDAPARAEKKPRRIVATWVGRDRVRVTWPERDDPADNGFLRWRVRLSAVDGTNDVFGVNAGGVNFSPRGVSENVTPVVEDGLLAGAEVGGLRPGASYRVSVVGPRRWRAGASEHDAATPLASDVFELSAAETGRGAPAAPSQVGAQVTGPDSVRLTWSDNSGVETGYEIWSRKWSGQDPDQFWHRSQTLASNARSADIEGLLAEEEIFTTRSWLEAKVGRYSFVVVAYNERGFSASDTFDFEFMPGPHPEGAAAAGQLSDCHPHNSGLELDGYRVHMCVETPDGARRRAWDYGLEADQSGLLHFFGRDNVEVLVKVLDGCAINGHRWVFVAPVTTLAFKLTIRELGPRSATRRQEWFYDSERRAQEEFDTDWVPVRGPGNPQGRTARTVSDTMAFPCTGAEIAAAKKRVDASTGDGKGLRQEVGHSQAASRQSLRAGAGTGCEPGGPALTLGGGYRVSMCYETESGETGAARDWGLESNRMGLLYFSDRDLVDALIKVRDDCAVSGNVSVFVAPATRAAFNLRVESPGGHVWTHSNLMGQTAEAVSDISAFPCAGAPPVSVSFAASRYEVSEGETVQVAVRLNQDPGRDVMIPLALTHRGGVTDADYTAPESVTFTSGVTVREFEFMAATDSDEDDGESVVLGIERLPLGVSGGGSTTVSIRDTPPMALFRLEGAECGSELCKTITGKPVRFVDVSKASVRNRRWEFGDGAGHGYGETVDHSWSTPGFYEVVLWISDGTRESTSSRTFLVEASDPVGTCEPDEATLCLGDSRYRVRARWRTADGAQGQASVAHAGTNDSGLFWFFGRENWEMLIKVLDGCAVNEHVWVYGASTTDLGYTIRVSDTVTGDVKLYRNAPGKPAPAITDNKAFPDSCAASGATAAASVATLTDRLPAPPGAGSVVDLDSLQEEVALAESTESACVNCLQNGRYRVHVWWQSSPDGDYNYARRAPAGTRDSALYSFFDPRNWEMLVKVLDGCAVNGQHWVFAASATDLGFRIQVTDTETDEVWWHFKRAGKPADAITETEAFPNACRQ